MTLNAFLAHGRNRSITLPVERELAWTEWGPSDGRPVLFCTGAGMSGSMGFGLESLADYGLKLMGIDRPGLGRSSQDPRKNLLSWASDIRYLIQVENLKDVTTIGFSQGAPFAYALAADGLVKKAAIVSGQDDLWNIRAHLPAAVQQFVVDAVENPSQVERMVMADASPAWLWRTIMEMSSTKDRSFYSTPDFEHAYRMCLEEGFSQGAEGYTRDLIISIGPWPFLLEKIQTPVDLWYGELDTSPVHSLDFGLTQSKRLPFANLFLRKDDGGSLLWTHAKSILAGLAR